MLEEKIKTLYEKQRLAHYRRIFGQVKERLGSLSATEAYAADVIYLLDHPTIKQFSDFLGISQPNATYKINSLISKGYVVKKPSPTDKREYVLEVSDKFMDYMGRYETVDEAVGRLREKLSPEELELLEKLLTEFCDAL